MDTKALLIKEKLEGVFEKVKDQRHGLDSAIKVENYRNWPGPTDPHNSYQAKGVIQFEGGHIKYEAIMNTDFIELKTKSKTGSKPATKDEK